MNRKRGVLKADGKNKNNIRNKIKLISFWCFGRDKVCTI